MIIKQLDFISPRVTFYHQGFLYHSSLFSGILSIISIILIILFISYYLLRIIRREEINTFYYNSFVEDAPTFKMNSSSFFHFINIAQNSRINFYEGIDFTAFRIIGVQRHYISYLTYNNLKTFEHWLYGYCDNDTDTEGISNLITYDFFGRTACVKKYFDLTDQKYYEKGDEKFIYPELAHGTFNKNNKIYNIIIERCKEDTIGYILGDGFHCRNDSQMIEYYKNIKGARVFQLYFVNNLINVMDYKNPIKKSIYRLETTFKSNQFSQSDVSYNPMKLLTHNGFVLDHTIEENSYTFDRDDVYVEDKGNTDLFMVYSFLLKNIMNYYERNYKRIQDIFSSIGGIYQVVIIIATYTNYLYSNFVVLSDTQILLHGSIHNEKNIFNKRMKEYKIRQSNIREFVKEKEKDKNKDIKKISEKNKFNDSNIKGSRNEKTYNEIENSKSNNKIINESEELRKKYEITFNKIERENVLNNKDTKTKYEKTNFFNYCLFKISCGKKHTFFNVYDKFRKKIISEEHLVRNHLNIYNLLRITEKKRNRKNSYQLKDLIRLV